MSASPTSHTNIAKVWPGRAFVGGHRGLCVPVG